MTSNENPVAKSESLDSSRISLFGPPPLLEREDMNAYDELLAQVSAAVKPRDFIEAIWIRDIADLTWEIFRWRALNTKLLPPVLEVYCPSDWDLERTERVNHLITIIEGRRNAVLREIDRRRAVFAQTPHANVKNIEDAEFKTVEAKAIAHKDRTRNKAA